MNKVQNCKRFNIILMLFIFTTLTKAVQNPTKKTNRSYDVSRSSDLQSAIIGSGQILITIPSTSTHSCDLLYVIHAGHNLGYSVNCYLNNLCRYVYAGNGGIVGCINSPSPTPGVSILITNTETLADGQYYTVFARWGSWGIPAEVGPRLTIRNGEAVGLILGDPHVTNIKGEKFDVLQTGNHTLVHMPQGAEVEQTLLDVQALVTRSENQNLNRCYESWIQKVWITGKWLEKIHVIEFSTVTDDEFNSPHTIQMRIDNLPATFPENYSNQLAPFYFEVKTPETILAKPTKIHKEVVTKTLKLHIGLAIVEISWAYMLTKDGGNNHLNVATSYREGETIPIGGILGMDDHAWATSLPTECKKHKASTQQVQPRSSIMRAFMLQPSEFLTQ